MWRRTRQAKRRPGPIGRVLCACACSLTGTAAAPGETFVQLRPGESHTMVQRADQSPVYQFDAQAGAAYLIDVAQAGLDVVLRIEQADGRLVRVDAPTKRDGHEYLLTEAAAAGPIRVTVSSREHTGAIGSHTITISELDGATGSPERRAYRLMTHAASANLQGGRAAWQASADAYRRAHDAWQSIGRTAEAAQALYGAAFVLYWQLFDWPGAAELAARAAALYRELGAPGLAANATQLQAAALIEQANESGAAEPGQAAGVDALFDRALALFEAAHETQQALGRDYDAAQIVNNIGLTHYYRGDFVSARQHWEQAASQFRALDEWSAESLALMNLSVVDMEAGQLAAAIRAQERLVELLRQARERTTLATTLDNLGVSYRLFGRVSDALEAHASALEIHRRADNLEGQAISLAGIGQAYFAAGDRQLAAIYLQQALPVARSANDSRVEESILRYLGNVAFLNGDFIAARRSHELALELAGSPADRAYLNILIAQDLRAAGEGARAVEVAGAAAEEAGRIASDMLLALAHKELGRSYLAAGDPAGAQAPLGRALSVLRSIDMRSEQADALHGLALVARAQGHPEQAAVYGEQALQVVETLRAEVSDPELRALYASRHRSYFDAQIDLLMALDGAHGAKRGRHVRDALAVSERSRARLIADLLSEAAMDLSRDADPELVRTRAALREELADRRYQQSLRLRGGSATRIATRSLAEIETELKLVEARIRSAGGTPAVADPADLVGPAAMQAMLEPGTILLQYALGESRSHAWLVTPDSITGISLADRASIENAARQVFEQLRDHQPRASARRELAGRLRRLAELVIAPLPDLPPARRLILASDGALHFVPFGVLPAPGDSGRSLVETMEIVTVPSMSAVALQRGRAFEVPDKTLAVFADPVFDASDPRLGRNAVVAMSGGAATPPLDAFAPGGPAGVLMRLPATGAEARAIAALVPADQRLVATGFEAGRTALLGTDLGAYRYLHIATHGLIDTRYPALTALALSAFDADGRPRDGLVRLSDIYELRLNAELVVLSACETALGRQVRGEGLLGLSQGFLYAGARSLLVSLWQVPDGATGELMGRMYDHLIEDGARPATALRQAQLSMSADRRWRDPYFWGAMTLLGDWQ